MLSIVRFFFSFFVSAVAILVTLFFRAVLRWGSLHLWQIKSSVGKCDFGVHSIATLQYQICVPYIWAEQSTCACMTNLNALDGPTVYRIVGWGDKLLRVIELWHCTLLKKIGMFWGEVTTWMRVYNVVNKLKSRLFKLLSFSLRHARHPSVLCPVRRF